jgi:hypothetical protein
MKASEVRGMVAVILASALFVACEAPVQQQGTLRNDWRYSEIVSVIDAYRVAQAAGVTKIPKKVNAIEIDGANSLKVTLSDYGSLSGFGYWLTLRRSPTGVWTVSESASFDQ